MHSLHIPDWLVRCLQAVRSQIMQWSVQRPILTLTLVLISCVALLPAITATALMPIVLLVDLSSFLSTKGIVYVVYTIIFQGLVLAVLLVLLFFAAFAIATSASVLHSYQFFKGRAKR